MPCNPDPPDLDDRFEVVPPDWEPSAGLVRALAALLRDVDAHDREHPKTPAGAAAGTKAAG
jgi:hypothetical protein